MKLNKNKIIVSALGLAIASSLVGSVGSTIAWYQYSTRANVSFIGKSGGFSGNLQMRFKGEDDNSWRTRITWQEMNKKLADNGYAQKIVPMTFGEMDKEDEIPTDGAQTPAPLGYIQPIAGIKSMDKWQKAKKENYAQFELQLRYNERDGVNEGNVVKDVYLSKLLIQEDVNNVAGKEDLSNAVRVHLSTSYKEERLVVPTDPQVEPYYALFDDSKVKLISNEGKTIATHGLLDLDGDGHADRAYPESDEFGFKDIAGETLQAITYGEGYQSSFANSENFVPGTKWTAQELADIATIDQQTGKAIADAYGKSLDDWKKEPVYYTQDEIDAAQSGDPAYGKTTEDIKTPGVHWTQDELDLADAAHGKTINDYKVDPIYPVKVENDGNAIKNLDYDDDQDEQANPPKEPEDITPRVDKLIGKTMESDTEFLSVTVTIWVEGWQKLDGSAIWDATKYVDSKFDIGLQFAVQDAFAE